MYFDKRLEYYYNTVSLIQIYLYKQLIHQKIRLKRIFIEIKVNIFFKINFSNGVLLIKIAIISLV
jgi:hypothetical protein